MGMMKVQIFQGTARWVHLFQGGHMITHTQRDKPGITSEITSGNDTLQKMTLSSKMFKNT